MVMVTAAPPSRSVDQAICDIADGIDTLVKLGLQQQATVAVVNSQPARSRAFNVTVAGDVGVKPVRVLNANADRYSFLIQTPVAGTFMVADHEFDVSNTPPVQGSEFGLDGYIGDVWVAALSGPVTFTIIEQLIGQQ